MQKKKKLKKSQSFKQALSDMGSYWCSWWRCGCWYQQNQECQEVAEEKQQPLTEKNGIYGQEYDCW